MPDCPRRPREAFTAGLICLALAACVTETVPTPRVDRARPAVELARRPPPAEAAAAGPGEISPAHMRAEVQPRGTIPYDDMTLPLVSPDGRYLATQTGLPPDWPTVLAEAGAIVPDLTRVEVYELPLEGRQPPRFVTIVEEPALLGRACDADGFLVEAPRGDGSRWIGRAAWTTGAVTWLVADPDTVSAFATLGPSGSLAWSSRPAGADHFDLVVRRGGDEWRLPARETDWLMPTWSGAGAGLFALLLRGGMLDAVYMDTTSRDDMRRTIQRLPLSNSGATVETAYQVLNATAVPADAGRAHLTFFHPARRRAAVWRPPGIPVLLDAGSFAALVDPAHDDFVLVATTDDLVRHRLTDDRLRSKLMKGAHIPRSTTSAERPYVLLEPADGVIGITVMKLLR